MTQNDVSPRYPARTAWIQKIKAASEAFIEMEKKKREKAYQCKFDTHQSDGLGSVIFL